MTEITDILGSEMKEVKPSGAGTVGEATGKFIKNIPVGMADVGEEIARGLGRFGVDSGLFIKDTGVNLMDLQGEAFAGASDILAGLSNGLFGTTFDANKSDRAGFLDKLNKASDEQSNRIQEAMKDPNWGGNKVEILDDTLMKKVLNLTGEYGPVVYGLGKVALVNLPKLLKGKTTKEAVDIINKTSASKGKIATYFNKVFGGATDDIAKGAGAIELPPIGGWEKLSTAIVKYDPKVVEQAISKMPPEAVSKFGSGVSGLAKRIVSHKTSTALLASLGLAGIVALNKDTDIETTDEKTEKVDGNTTDILGDTATAPATGTVINNATNKTNASNNLPEDDDYAFKSGSPLLPNGTLPYKYLSDQTGVKWTPKTRDYVDSYLTDMGAMLSGEKGSAVRNISLVYNLDQLRVGKPEKFEELKQLLQQGAY